MDQEELRKIQNEALIRFQNFSQKDITTISGTIVGKKIW